MKTRDASVAASGCMLEFSGFSAEAAAPSGSQKAHRARLTHIDPIEVWINAQRKLMIPVVAAEAAD